MNNFNRSISTPLSVGNWYQNLFFYSLIACIFFINLYLIKRKKGHSHAAVSEELSGNELALNETISTLTAKVSDLRKELVAIGEELELAYIQSDKANGKLLEALDCFSTEVELPDVGYWSVDLETQELFISDNGRQIHGLSKEARLTFSDGVDLIDEEFREDFLGTIATALKTGSRIVKNYRITTADAGESKWLMTSGNVTYNDRGAPLRLSGSFVIISA